MDQYRAYYINIRESDVSKVNDILIRHDAMGDLDDYTYCSVPYTDEAGNRWVTYKIKPYIYEDLETIIGEFKQAGILVK